MVEEYKLDWLEKRCKKQLNIFNNDGKVCIYSDDDNGDVVKMISE